MKRLMVTVVLTMMVLAALAGVSSARSPRTITTMENGSISPI